MYRFKASIAVAGLIGISLFGPASGQDVLVIGREGSRCADDRTCINRIHYDIPMTARAEAGQTIVFFPEGTFSPRPGLLPFHLGAFLTAVRARVPLVPVVLRGNQLEWRKTKRSAGRGFFVDWAAGAECGHEGYDFNETTSWEIRRVGTTKWQPIGEARRLRYRRSFCVNYAGEP